MSLINKVPAIIDYIEANAENLKHNKEVFNILEGDLKTSVINSLREQLVSPRAIKDASQRVAPINIYKRIVDKLSKIYSTPIIRKSTTEKESDQELIDYYVKQFNLNAKMGDLNFFTNALKCGAGEPFLDDLKAGEIFREPRYRVIPPHRFLVYSDDAVDPLRPTVFIKFMGERLVGEKKERVIYLYSDTEFLAINGEGEVLADKMPEDAEHDLGVIPMLYANKSNYLLIPTQDSDMLALSILIPHLLTDLAFAIKYQAYSILYGINVDSKNLEINPNAFWLLTSDGDKKPELGQIKPEVDIDKVLDYIQRVIALWLETKNIKPGASGQMTIDNAQSGVALMIQNADTTDDRKQQIILFESLERELWQMIKVLHNDWVIDKQIKETRLFSEDFGIDITFEDPKPFQDFKSIVEEQKLLIDNGLSTKKRALQAIYPNMSDTELDKLIDEIADEQELTINITDDDDDDVEDLDNDKETKTIKDDDKD